MFAVSDSVASIDMGDAGAIQISFDNESDAECTVITVEGKDQSHLLMSLSGAFTSAGLNVVSAIIASDDGKVLDVFRVRQMDGNKVRRLWLAP